MFCIYLRTNSDLCHLQHKLIGFYNRDENYLQRGTDWVFKYSSLRFVLQHKLIGFYNRDEKSLQRGTDCVLMEHRYVSSFERLKKAFILP